MTNQVLDAACEAWNNIAAEYDEFVSPTELWLANQALSRARLRAGDRFLDVAAGCGGLSLPAARLGAKVLATDWSPEMIRRFEARAREERLTDVEGRVMDCHALHIDDGVFDVTASQFGVMLVPDQLQALREMARVTRAGGRVLLIAYGPHAEIEFLHFFVAAVIAVNPAFGGIPASPPPLEFQVSDAGVLRQRLVSAGLGAVTVDTVTERLEFLSGQHMWDWVLGSNPIAGRMVADLDAQQRTEVRAVLDGMLRERAGRNGLAVLTNPVHIGIGVK